MGLEIVGADEIVGDDWLEDEDDIEGLLGAPLPQFARQRLAPGRAVARRPQANYMRARLQAAAAKAGSAAAVVRAERPTESRALVIGFESLAVAAAATATVTTRPQVLFRPTRLVVPSATAPNFVIDDIKVGNKSQLIAAGGIPAEAFSQTAFNTPLKMDTCQISMDLIVEAENISAAAADFRAAMYGDVVF